MYQVANTCAQQAFCISSMASDFYVSICNLSGTAAQVELMDDI